MSVDDKSLFDPNSLVLKLLVCNVEESELTVLNKTYKTSFTLVLSTFDSMVFLEFFTENALDS